MQSGVGCRQPCRFLRHGLRHGSAYCSSSDRGSKTQTEPRQFRRNSLNDLTLVLAGQLRVGRLFLGGRSGAVGNKLLQPLAVWSQCRNDTKCKCPDVRGLPPGGSQSHHDVIRVPVLLVVGRKDFDGIGDAFGPLLGNERLEAPRKYSGVGVGDNPRGVRLMRGFDLLPDVIGLLRHPELLRHFVDVRGCRPRPLRVDDNRAVLHDAGLLPQVVLDAGRGDPERALQGVYVTVDKGCGFRAFRVPADDVGKLHVTGGRQNGVGKLQSRALTGFLAHSLVWREESFLRSALLTVLDFALRGDGNLRDFVEIVRFSCDGHFFLFPDGCLPRQDHSTKPSDNFGLGDLLLLGCGELLVVPAVGYLLTGTVRALEPCAFERLEVRDLIDIGGVLIFGKQRHGRVDLEFPVRIFDKLAVLEHPAALLHAGVRGDGLKPCRVRPAEISNFLLCSVEISFGLVGRNAGELGFCRDPLGSFPVEVSSFELGVETVAPVGQDGALCLRIVEHRRPHFRGRDVRERQWRLLELPGHRVDGHPGTHACVGLAESFLGDVLADFVFFRISGGLSRPVVEYRLPLRRSQIAVGVCCLDLLKLLK